MPPFLCRFLLGPGVSLSPAPLALGSRLALLLGPPSVQLSHTELQGPSPGALSWL